MTEGTKTIKGWKMFMYALFLGPFFLTAYFRETRNSYPAARYFGWVSILLIILCSYMMFTFSFSPSIIRIAYLIIFFAIFGLAFFYCWGLDSASKTGEPALKQKYSLSRGLAWMIVMGILFQGLSNIARAIYFWILGEQVMVYFSPQENIFRFWIFIGFIYGIVYGIVEGNRYIDLDIKSVLKSIFIIFIFIVLYSGFMLALVVYPIQRLISISYFPQSDGFLFYLFFFIAIPVSALYLLRTSIQYSSIKNTLMLFIGVPLIALHVILISTYSVTINLAVASIMEDRQQFSSAKTIYAKTIRYIRHDNLLASLYHRQGVLHVLNQDYDLAVASFKKVLADYSEDYNVFNKSRRYIDAFEKNQAVSENDRKILLVKHRTFEQAASCFPNSLSLILNFYEEQPISTRKLSYAIKEGFSMGTFIWKAESFLEKNGYELITTFWQDKNTLVALLEEGYPVLVYIPGHVYTLYGYDSLMEMFFTYDTAQSNRWDDKPFWNFQVEWMIGSFLMSVVVPQGDMEFFSTRFPQLKQYSRPYQLWQKAHISDYYEDMGTYWKDYDRYELSKSFGIDRLKMNEPYYLDDAFYPFTWDEVEWENDVLPILKEPWALDWSITENYILYLLYSGKSREAAHLVEQYESNLSKEPLLPFPRLLELKLATQAALENENEILSVSDNLIGISSNSWVDSYWGYYFKARHLMASGDLQGAAELLISTLDNLSLGQYRTSPEFRYIVDALKEISDIDSSIIDPEKRQLLEVAKIELAVGP